MTQEKMTPFEIRAEKLTRLGIRGLRVTPEYYALMTAQRGAVRSGTYCGENAGVAGAAVLNITTKQQLFQQRPEEKTDPKLLEFLKKRLQQPWEQNYRSFTHSYESYEYAADKEIIILETNNRLPTKEILWQLLIDLTAKEINELRAGVFRDLANQGLEAITNIELTRDSYGNPTNRVHFHILTDDQRSEKELENLVIKPCERRGFLEGNGNDFTVSCKVLPEPETIFPYFTKRSRTNKKWCEENGKYRVILFVPGLRIHKFREIKRGTWLRESRKELWKEFIEKTYG